MGWMCSPKREMRSCCLMSIMVESLFVFFRRAGMKVSSTARMPGAKTARLPF